MIIGVSDTHRQRNPGLSGHLKERIADAEAVLHAGDFTTEAVLDAFQKQASELYAVAGNSDAPGVRSRLPTERTIEIDGRRIVLTHGDQHSPVALSLLGRQEQASLVVVGHTHRPRVIQRENLVVVNPGSHSEPRGAQAGYMELDLAVGTGRVCTLEGTTIQSFEVKEGP